MTDVNEAGVGPISDTDGAADYVLENAANGTTAGLTANAIDPDGTDSVSYSLDDDASGRFTIDANTGVVTVNGAIDREAAGTYNITVRATSTDTSTVTQVFTITIGDVDEFDITSPTDTDAAVNEVDENVVIGTTVGLTADAFDLDATNNTISYSLTSNPDGLFQIDANTGVVTTAAAIDRETHGATRSITVQATSSDGSTATQVFNVTINDLDEFDVSTPTDVNGATNEVDENVAIGTTVGVTADAFDLDSTNNTITYSLTSNPDGLFQIDANTGVVTTAAAIDREAHGATRSVTVEATSSDGSSATQTFNITINDLDEFDVTTPTDTDATVNEVDENVAIGTTVGLTADAFDLDATNNTITYSLTSNPDGLFQIDANTGVVTTAAAIDREAHGATRSITVQASSSDGSTATQSFNITINDLDEFDVTSPTDTDAAVNEVDENVAIGTTVGLTANAFDLDATNNTITYSLTSNPDGLFQIDANTGVVTTAASIDRETHSATRSITVQATSSDGSVASQSFNITINDVDEFDVTVPTDVDAAIDEVTENVVIGTTVGITADAFDLDATNNTITYSLTSNPDGLFTIDANTGVVTTAAAIDRETHGATRSITVQATSSDGSVASQSFNITISDVDEFDVTVPTDADAAIDEVTENVVIGTTVGITADAFDLDATNNTITYSLTSNPDGLFTIDANTGVVTTAAAIDRETHGATRSITVQATSNDGSVASQSFNITISDVDEFDVTVPTDVDAAIDEVTENVVIGTTVGITADAFDLDATNNTITYSLTSNPDGLFTIDANTGVVTTTAAIDREVHGATRSITVEAASSDGSTASQSFNIAINDVDEFDVTVPTDVDAATDEVTENVVIGTTVGITADAFDLDATNNTITYSLTSNPDGLFQIDTNTGVVTTAAAIDREVHGATRSITVEATSSDGSIASQSFNITINDLDEFDVSLPTDSDATADEVDENVVIGTTVGITADAFDLDATNNTITYSLTSNPDGLFQIDANTGVVTTATAIDREVHGATRSITVEAASSDGSTASQSFNIAINDVDEFDVTVPTDVDAATDEVTENVVIGTTVGITADAFDLDATNNTITYSLTSNPDGLFTIDANTGVVTTAAAIDRETHGATRSITVQATSSDGSVASQSFNIAINDVDEFDVTVPTDVDAATDEVTENVVIGTTVGITADAFDLDATNNTITYSLTSNPDGLFTIDANTGVVTTTAAIDREVHGATRSITVEAASSDGSTASQSFNIAINDVDEFDVTVPTDVDAATDEVTENVVIGTTVGITADAFDLDATNNTITYSLTSNPDGLFTIDTNTGVVTTAAAIDRETHGATRSITVEAASSDGSVASQSFNITISDVDEFDVTVPTDADAAIDEVTENVVIGTTVGITADAFDLDATNNTITYSLTSNPDGLFTIDANTGVVTTAAAIDREVHGATRSITVEAASSDGSTASQSFNITINDVDEFDVTVPTDVDAATDEVTENVVIGTTVGITADAFDLDATNNSITYSLTSNPDGLFTIDTNTGVVTTATAIDREVHGATRSITVEAASSDGSIASQSFNITINDLDEFDVGPITDSDGAANSVAENASIGTTVGITALAADADATNNAITYTLDDDAGGRFAIDGSTGEITVNAALDYETNTSHNVIVRATSSDGSSNTQNFTINVTDVSEFGATPIVDNDGTSDSVSENASIGTTVGVTAFSDDADATDSITYSLDDNDGGRFAIDSSTGIVTVAGAIDRETDGATRAITVRATSTDGSFQTRVFAITIDDVDEFDVGLITDSDATANAVDENAANGTVVGVTALASDADATNNTILYTLDDNAGGRFAIDSSTGVVTVADGTLLDREAAASHDITVRATSSDGSFNTQLMTININDVDEFDVGAVTDSDGTANAVDENAIAGTVVGITASATDDDATTNTITYSLFDDDGGRFTIDSNSGVVTVAGAIDREADGATRNITVRATSADGSFTDQVLAININDVDEFDVGAITDSDGTANAVDENAIAGTVVGITASASDNDATTNTITYSLFDNDGGRFAIDSNTGVVTVAGAIDREADGATRNITVRATSADGSFTDQVLAININDVDEFDVGAVTDSDLTVNAANENPPVGLSVGIVAMASDLDATTNGIIYTLVDNDGGRFDIDGASGLVTVAGAIDREADGPTRNITVRATSADGSFTDQVFVININDVDEFDVGAIVDSDGAADLVAENANIGDAAGITALASDADATNNTILYSLDDDAGGRFAIDGSTGLITVNAALDYESNTSHNVIVRATSSDGSFSTQNFTINVTDVSEFGATPIVDNDAASDSVSENASIGTTVGVTAFSDDADATDSITYSLDDNDGGRFAIDSSTGIVTVAGAIDREADGATRSITVRATSTDGSFQTRVFTITVDDVDEFDVGPITDNDGAANSVDENAANGTVVGVTALASDADATNNTILYTLDDNAGGRFAIDSSTGVVTVADGTLLDREAAASHDITVRATSSDGSFNSQLMTININDVDEFDVGAVTDSDGTVNAVDENVFAGTVVGITASASDNDSTTNTITYSLFDDDGGRFTIDSNSGVVTVAGAIDREADGATRNITVRATSADGSFTDQVLAININDVDEFDVGPITDTDGAADLVAENANIGDAVGITALASDADATNDTILYSLDDDAGGRFAIDGSTGLITVNAALDYESNTSHNVIVRATSSDGSFSTQNFTINVTDVSEFGATPIVDNDATSDSVSENASIGTTVGVTAFSDDADATDAITYSLDDNDGGRFAIDSSTGIVTVAGAIDREADGATRSITVRATSTDGSFQTRVFTITVDDVDEFDVGPITDNDGAANSVDENAANGTVVGVTALASDADATNNTILYTLDDNAGGRFAIDSSTGVVTVADGTLLDREAAASHDITVRATSSDGSFNSQLMTININDVDEFDVGAVTDSDGTANAVDENAIAGTVVGITASATDDDATTNTITYSLFDDDGGRFTIDSNSGVVTVAGAIDREADGATRNITVRATSADGSFTDQVFAININDVDEFDVGAVVDSDGTANAVDENAVAGTVVGITASATDDDATTNAITYSLFDDDGGRFTIDSNSGVVTVAGAIDREADGATRNITVRATSADGSFTDQMFAININDVDEFDVGAVVDSDGTANAVDENAIAGTVVGITASATDDDATTNAITYSLFDDDGGRFTIDSNSGVVTVAGAIDREADGATRNITVRATSADGSFADQVFAINVNDVDEFDVGAVTDSDLTVNAANENPPVGLSVGIVAMASDLDATTNSIIYTLVDNDGGRFDIDGASGLVTVAGAIDREADGATRNITVRATSADGSFTDQVLAININDVDEFDVGPITDTDGAADSVAENANIGDSVGITALASDADATNNTILYSLDDDAGGRFAIDGSTGQITVNAALDYETNTSHNVIVRATSSDGSFSTQNFTINVTDVSEFGATPIVDNDGTSDSVSENASIGTTVGVTAFSDDADATDSITYSLDDNDGGRFAIDSSTGIVTVAGAIDREADGATRSITVRATSTDGSFQTHVFTIAIDDVDEFDVGRDHRQ